MSMSKKQRREYKTTVRIRRDDAKERKRAYEAKSCVYNAAWAEALQMDAARSAPAPAADTLP